MKSSTKRIISLIIALILACIGAVIYDNHILPTLSTILFVAAGIMLAGVWIDFLLNV